MLSKNSKHNVLRRSLFKGEEVSHSKTWCKSGERDLGSVAAGKREKDGVVSSPSDHLPKQICRRGVNPMHVLDYDYQATFIGHCVNQIKQRLLHLRVNEFGIALDVF